MCQFYKFPVFSAIVGNRLVMECFAETIGIVAVFGFESLGKRIAFVFKNQARTVVVVEDLKKKRLRYCWQASAKPTSAAPAARLLWAGLFWHRCTMLFPVYRCRKALCSVPAMLCEWDKLTFYTMSTVLCPQKQRRLQIRINSRKRRCRRKFHKYLENRRKNYLFEVFM